MRGIFLSFKINYRLQVMLLILALAHFEVVAQVEKPVGINLSPVKDFSSEFVFVDVFKQSRNWISHNLDGSGVWDTGINIPLDESGYPLSIPYHDGINPPQAVRALLLWDLVEPFPTGEYQLIVEGEGQISLEFGASGTFTCPVNTMVSVSGAMAIRIEASSSENPISNIQLIRPGYTNGLEDQTFTDELLDFLNDFQVIRFMDWMQTNNSPVTSWSDRTQVDYFTQTTDTGVAYEYIVELANTLEKDIWINIPHQADDDYIIKLAEFLENHLHSESQIYLEYSNELWNGIFLQNTYASDMGNDLGFTGPSWEKGWKYTVYRSTQIFSLFEAAFEDNERLIKIIPSQAANSWLSEQLISYLNNPLYNPSGIEADALAIAPYFASNVANAIVVDGEVNSITISEILERMDASLAQVEMEISENMAVSTANGLELIAYEGGQHLLGTGGNENNDLLTQKLTAANHHPDLEQIYCDYLDYWYQTSGALFTHFNSHYPYSKWGSWGVKETMNDFDNPKYQSLQNCVFNANTLPTVEHTADLKKIIAYPNPSFDGRFKLTCLPVHSDWELFDLKGKKIDAIITYKTAEVIEIVITKAGTYILRSGSQAVKLVVR